jgi:hypothetical protein
MLPPLGALSLGTPTGAKGDVVTEIMDEKKEILRRRNMAERQAAARETASLAGLPPEVIGTMVTQAALAARDTQEPASTICEWMKNFCRSAGNQGQKCDDQWYRLALAAFGFVPQGTVQGVQPSPPSDSAFTSWSEFFGALCEAFHGSNGLSMPQDRYNVLRWPGMKMVDPLFDEDNRKLNSIKRGFIDPAMTQRVMDERLSELRGNRMGAWDPHPGHLTADQQEKRDSAFDEYVEQLMRSSKAPWTALVLLLKMRGAMPLDLTKWRKLDWDLYAIVVLRKHGKLALLEALDQARDVLDRGADPNVYPGGYEAYRPGMPTVPEHIPEYNRKAIMELLIQPFDPEDAPLIELFVERGIKPLISDMGTDILLRRTLAPDWTVDQQTTEKLLRHVLRQQVVVNNRILRKKLSNYKAPIRNDVDRLYDEDEGIDDEIPPPTKVPNNGGLYKVQSPKQIDFMYNLRSGPNSNEYHLQEVVYRIRRRLLEAGTSVPGWLRDLWTAQYETLLKTRERFEERLLELRRLYAIHLLYETQLPEMSEHWAKLRKEPTLPPPPPPPRQPGQVVEPDSSDESDGSVESF